MKGLRKLRLTCQPSGRPTLVAKWACFAILCYFLVAYVSARVHGLPQVQKPRLDWLLIASGFATVSLLIYPISLRCLVQAHGLRVAYHRAMGLCYLPMLGKYVPGKVWSVVGAFYLYSREGIPKRVAVTCIMLLTTLGIASGTIVALAFMIGRDGGGQYLLPASLMLAALLTVSSPQVLYPVLNAILRRLSRPAIEERLSALHLARILSILVASVVVYGLGFTCLVGSFAEIPLAATPYLVGLFAFAQIAGFLAIFAPAGIGVREGILIAGLIPLVGPGPAIVISGVCRLWQTALELIMVGIGWLGLKYGKPTVAPESVTGPPCDGDPETVGPPSCQVNATCEVRS